MTANAVRGNLISGFGDSGIELEEGNDRNRGRLNGFNGLEVGRTGNTVSRNTCDDNVEFGICVAAGNTDGGGNRAEGNGGGQVSFACP